MCIRDSLNFKSKRERNKPLRKELAKKSLKQIELAIQLTDSPQRLSGLKVSAAKAAMDAGQSEKAQGFGEQLLKEADAKDFDAIHHGNTILGRVALQAGEIPEAKAHLLASGRVSSSPVLGSFGPSMLLAKELLEKGEKEVVLEYFELCGKFWKRGADKLKAWEKQTKSGGNPDFGSNLVR